MEDSSVRNQKQLRWLVAILSVVVIIALVFAYLLFATSDNDGLQQLVANCIPSAIVALIAIPIIYFLFESKGINIREYYSSNRDANVSIHITEVLKKHEANLEKRINQIKTYPIRGLKDFRPDRKNIPTFSSTFSLASFEIIIWGATLEKLRTEFTLLTEKLKSGCEIKILVMASNNEKNKENPLIPSHDQVTAVKGTRERLLISHRDLKEFYESLEEKLKHRIQIRQFTIFHTASYIFIDRKNNGFVRIEPNLIGFKSQDLPSFDIDNSAEHGLFGELYKSFEKVWESSRSLV